MFLTIKVHVRKSASFPTTHMTKSFDYHHASTVRNAIGILYYFIYISNVSVIHFLQYIKNG